MPDIDYGQILEALNDKTDRDLGNITNDGKSLISKMATPDRDVYDELTLAASSTEYTAPADGTFRTVMFLSPATYFFVNKTDWPGTVPDSNAITGCYFPQTNAGAGGDWVFSWKVKKGEKFKIAYTGTPIAKSFMFIYDKGSESEYTPS